MLDGVHMLLGRGTLEEVYTNAFSLEECTCLVRAKNVSVRAMYFNGNRLSSVVSIGIFRYVTLRYKLAVATNLLKRSGKLCAA